MLLHQIFVFHMLLQHGHPYISAMVNNGSFHYDHDRDGTHTALDGCEAQFRQAKHETFIAIRYERNRLMVSQQAICDAFVTFVGLQCFDTVGWAEGRASGL